MATEGSTVSPHLLQCRVPLDSGCVGAVKALAVRLARLLANGSSCSESLDLEDIC
jgi:hypothetical protein